MPEFEDYDSLFNYVDAQTNIVLEDLAKIVWETLYDLVRVNFYGTYTPQLYQRTWDVLHSITISDVYQDGNNIVIDVFFDTNKIRPMISTFPLPYTLLKSKGLGRYHHHMDQNHNPMSEEVIFLMDEGYKFGLGRKRQGGHFLRDIIKWANNKSNYIDILNDRLRDKGIEVV